MYIINISVNIEEVLEEQADSMFEQHRQWFTRNFEKGNFLLLGSYKDIKNAGVIISQVESHEVLEKILEDDIYYPLKLANYEVNEFKAIMVAENINGFRDK